MTKKKILVSIMMILTLTTTLIGCGKKTAKTTKTEDTKVSTTIGNDDVSVEGLVGDAVDANIDEISDENEVNDILASITVDGNVTGITPYDITIVDDNDKAVQPKGKVTVTVPIAQTLLDTTGSEYAVYYYNPDKKSVELMTSSVSDNKISFETTHFSIYTVVRYQTAEEVAAELEASTETEDTETSTEVSATTESKSSSKSTTSNNSGSTSQSTTDTSASTQTTTDTVTETPVNATTTETEVLDWSEYGDYYDVEGLYPYQFDKTYYYYYDEACTQIAGQIQNKVGYHVVAESTVGINGHLVKKIEIGGMQYYVNYNDIAPGYDDGQDWEKVIA